MRRPFAPTLLLRLFGCLLLLAMAHAPFSAAAKANYFVSNYEQARDLFRLKSHSLKERFNNVETGAWKVPSQVDNDLTIDYVYIPAQKNRRKLLVLTSGIHGIEAFMGSSIQNYFISEELANLDVSELGVLIVHAMNPYGFKYHRRVTENNIDLNRNMSVSNELFVMKNPGYKKVEEMLNPKRKASLSSFRYYFSFVEMIYSILKYSMKPLRQAVLQGQYEYKKGLYFGGQNFEPQKQFIEGLFRRVSEPYQQILTIDLHTGFGKRAHLHLFGNSQADAKTKAKMQDVFKGLKIDTGDDDDFYTIHGDFTVFLGGVSRKDQIYIPMTFEYGTLDSQTTLGSVRSINNMILENQGFHWGFANSEDKKEISNSFKEMYYPSAKEWREKTLEQTKEHLPLAIKNFQNMKISD